MEYFFASARPVPVDAQVRDVAQLLEMQGVPYLVVIKGPALKILTGPDKAAALALIAELQAGALATAAEGLVNEP